MNAAPRGVRLHLALMGRTNAGKSSLLNLIAGQDCAITSPVPGTTTDTVEKAMELRPAGPVTLLDCAGLADRSSLGTLREAKALEAFQRADVGILTVPANAWGEPEERLTALARERSLPLIAVVTMIDRETPDDAFLKKLSAVTPEVLCVNASDPAGREDFLMQFTPAVLRQCPEDFLTPPPLLEDLVKRDDWIVLIVPIDKQAPKGRLILPQQQVLRSALDLGAIAVTVRADAYAHTLEQLKTPPALVICDSQVVDRMIRETPAGIPCTTFSILLARLKGDWRLFYEGSKAIDKLQDGDLVLIAEACTHHASCEDIGRVKIPRLLEKHTGKRLRFEFFGGRDFPEDAKGASLIVHCGACMLNRREMLWRLERARTCSVPVTNYGMCIARCQGVLERVMGPFLSGTNGGPASC